MPTHHKRSPRKSKSGKKSHRKSSTHKHHKKLDAFTRCETKGEEDILEVHLLPLTRQYALRTPQQCFSRALDRVEKYLDGSRILYVGQPAQFTWKQRAEDSGLWSEGTGEGVKTTEELMQWLRTNAHPYASLSLVRGYITHFFQAIMLYQRVKAFENVIPDDFWYNLQSKKACESSMDHLDVLLSYVDGKPLSSVIRVDPAIRDINGDAIRAVRQRVLDRCLGPEGYEEFYLQEDLSFLNKEVNKARKTLSRKKKAVKRVRASLKRTLSNRRVKPRSKKTISPRRRK